MDMKIVSMLLAMMLGIVSCAEVRAPAPERNGLTQMYAQACLELWEKDRGLNTDAEILAFDFTNCNTLDQEQRELLIQAVREQLGLETREGTFEQLLDEGLIVRPDPEEQPYWCEFSTGLLISLEDARQADGSVRFTLEKWRTPLGAYSLYDCEAISDDGIPEAWSYTVGAEMIS